METTLKNGSKIATSIINDFNIAWNEKDLSRLSNFLSDDIVYSNPPIKIGFFSLPGKEVHGKFNVLKFWKKFFKNFESVEEEKIVLGIKKEGKEYVVTCDAHNHAFNLSSKLILNLNRDYLISKISFTKVTKFKEDKEISIIGILLHQLKRKILN